MDSIGIRMKKYENVSRHFLTPRMPVIVRVDGRAFHSLTKRAEKPFDQHFMNAMVNAAFDVSQDIQGFKAAYIQSDEVTFLMTDYDDINTQGYFNYNHQKIVSITASMMSVCFNKYYGNSQKPAVFDSRAFNVPREDVVNNFLWRAKDWERNSLQMYARSLFSHKELHKKNSSDIHEMLHSIGKNWTTDLTSQQKNGTFIIGNDFNVEIKPSYEDINNAIGDLI